MVLNKIQVKTKNVLISKIKRLGVQSKIKLLKGISKKSHKRGYKKSLGILKFIIPHVKLKKIILPKNVVSINEILDIENNHLDLLNDYIKKEIISLQIKFKKLN